MVDAIARLSASHHSQVFNILNRHNVPYTQNINGLFFNFSPSVVPKEAMEEVETFLKFCKDNEAKLDAIDRLEDELRIQHQHQEQVVMHGLETVLLNQDDPSGPLDVMQRSKDERVQSLVTYLESNIDLGGAKKNVANNKFSILKKRFKKKHNSDAFGLEKVNNIEEESYIISK